MPDYQNSNEKGDAVPLKKITSLKQLLSSYLVSSSLVEIRNEREKELRGVAQSNIPKINTTDKEIIDLYESFAVVVDYKRALLEIAKKGLEDLEKYNFQDDASINKAASVDLEHLRADFSTSFALLADINLKDHTLRVFRHAIEAGEKKGRAIQIAIPILASLFHDYGKSSLIREKHLGVENGKAYKKHAAVSKIYIEEELRPIFRSSEETIDVLSRLVENHHPSNNKMKRNEDIAFIIEADHKARKEEIKILKEKLK